MCCNIYEKFLLIILFLGVNVLVSEPVLEINIWAYQLEFSSLKLDTYCVGGSLKQSTSEEWGFWNRSSNLLLMGRRVKTISVMRGFWIMDEGGVFFSRSVCPPRYAILGQRWAPFWGLGAAEHGAKRSFFLSPLTEAENGPRPGFPGETIIPPLRGVLHCCAGNGGSELWPEKIAIYITNSKATVAKIIILVRTT